jgi:hypothetical protein
MKCGTFYWPLEVDIGYVWLQCCYPQCFKLSADETTIALFVLQVLTKYVIY